MTKNKNKQKNALQQQQQEQPSSSGSAAVSDSFPFYCTEIKSDKQDTATTAASTSVDPQLLETVLYDTQLAMSPAAAKLNAFYGRSNTTKPKVNNIPEQQLPSSFRKQEKDFDDYEYNDDIVVYFDSNPLKLSAMIIVITNLMGWLTATILSNPTKTNHPILMQQIYLDVFSIGVAVTLVAAPSLLLPTTFFRIKASAAILVLWAFRLTYFRIARTMWQHEHHYHHSSFSLDLHHDVSTTTATSTSSSTLWTVASMTLWACACVLPSHGLGCTSSSMGNKKWVRIGWLLAVTGLFLQTLADYQKAVFQQAEYEKEHSWEHLHDHPDHPHFPSFIHTGLWAYAQQPNYFGEVLVWLGVFLMNVSALIPDPHHYDHYLDTTNSNDDHPQQIIHPFGAAAADHETASDLSDDNCSETDSDCGDSWSEVTPKEARRKQEREQRRKLKQAARNKKTEKAQQPSQQQPPQRKSVLHPLKKWIFTYWRVCVALLSPLSVSLSLYTQAVKTAVAPETATSSGRLQSLWITKVVGTKTAAATAAKNEKYGYGYDPIYTAYVDTVPTMVLSLQPFQPQDHHDYLLTKNRTRPAPPTPKELTTTEEDEEINLDNNHDAAASLQKRAPNNLMTHPSKYRRMQRSNNWVEEYLKPTATAVKTALFASKQRDDTTFVADKLVHPSKRGFFESAQGVSAARLLELQEEAIERERLEWERKRDYFERNLQRQQELELQQQKQNRQQQQQQHEIVTETLLRPSKREYNSQEGVATWYSYDNDEYVYGKKKKLTEKEREELETFFERQQQQRQQATVQQQQQPQGGGQQEEEAKASQEKDEGKTTGSEYENGRNEGSILDLDREEETQDDIVVGGEDIEVSPKTDVEDDEEDEIEEVLETVEEEEETMNCVTTKDCHVTNSTTTTIPEAQSLSKPSSSDDGSNQQQQQQYPYQFFCINATTFASPLPKIRNASLPKAERLAALRKLLQDDLELGYPRF